MARRHRPLQDGCRPQCLSDQGDSQGYPPDLETLVKGVDVQGKKVRYLRKIQIDPMTGTTRVGPAFDAGRPGFDSFGGQSVFDVYTKSRDEALDGTKV